MSWSRVKLGDILHRVKTPVAIEPEGAYKLVTIRLYHKGVVLRSVVKGEDLAAKTMNCVKSGQFILSGIDARNGAFGIVPLELDGAVVSNDFWCFDIDEERMDIEFFLKFTSTPLFNDICRKASEGTTQRIRLQAGKFFNQEIDLPDLELQKAIVSHLSTVEEEIGAALAEYDKQIAWNQQLRQAFLQEAMQGKLVPQNPDDEPASVLLEKIKVEKEQLIRENKLKRGKPLTPVTGEDIPFEIPENWVWCRVGEVTSVVRGGSPRPAGDSRFYGGTIPFLKVADLTSTDEVYLKSHTYTIKEAGLHKTRLVDADTLMLTNSGATLGIPKICTFTTTFNDGIAAFLDIARNVDKIYLYYFLKSKSQWLLDIASKGQGQPNLNTDIISTIIIPLPPLAEQKRIIATLEQLMRYCDELEQNIRANKEQAELILRTALQEALQPPLEEIVEEMDTAELAE